MNKHFKMIIADHDGTLVNDERQLSDMTREVLQKLHDKGVLFGLATGRSVGDVISYPQKWDLGFEFDVVIGMNGYQVWDGIHNEMHLGKTLKKEYVKEIIDLMRPFDLPVSIFEENVGYAVTRLTPEIKASFWRNVQFNNRIIPDEEYYYGREQTKILYRMPPELMPEVEKYVREHPSPHFCGLKTQSTVFEFMDESNTKSNGLKKLCDLLDIGPDEVIAFGDTTNDNDLLACCYGVCMINGSDDTKAIASDITEYSNNASGVAHYLKKHLLEEEL